MASAHAQTKFQPKGFCQLQFDGGIESVARASLILEFVKFILYERQQIPSPFEQVKHELKLLIDNSETEPENGKVKKKRNSTRLRVKKISNAVKNLETLFDNIQNAFEVCPEISQVLILFGSTPVSPKEHYLINLPPLDPEADNLSSKRCIQTMMRQLVMNDTFSQMKNVSPTNLYLFLRAPRNSGFQWFVPKLSYKIPNRGRELTLSLTCNQPPSSALLTTHFEEVVEISGIEPLDSSVLHRSCLEGLKDSNDDSYQCSTDAERGYITSSGPSLNSTGGETIINISLKSPADDSFCDNDNEIGCVDDVFCDNDYIWFQSPLVVKGFKNKSTTSSGVNWM